MIIKYEHHGKIVSVQEENKGKHRDNCLCWQGCKFFKPNPNNGDNCPVAQALYEFDVTHGVTTPVWECQEYKAAE